MLKTPKLPHTLALLTAAACLAACGGCCCGQGWVLPPEQELADYEGYQEYFEPEEHGVPCGDHAGKGHDCRRHHRSWLHHGGAIAAAEAEVVAIPYPKFHPVPARPVFGPATLISWPAPAAPPLPGPPPSIDQPPPPEDLPSALPPHQAGPPLMENSQPPQLLGNPQPRGSWVFKAPSIKKLAAPPATRRTPIVEAESRQAIQDRMQPIRR